MKLVESSIIAKAENIFFQSFHSVFEIKSIQKIFQSDIFKSLFKDNIKLHLSGNAQYQDAEALIYKDQVAFRFDFNVQGDFAVIIDRIGNFIGFEEPADGLASDEKNSDLNNRIVDIEIVKSREAQIVIALADAIDKQDLANLLEKKSLLKFNDQIEFKDGRIVAVNSSMMYKLTYTAEIKLAFMVNRTGKLLSFSFAKPHSQHDGTKNQSNPDNTNNKINQSFDSTGNDRDADINHADIIDGNEFELIEDIDLDAIEDLILSEMDGSSSTDTSYSY